MVTFILFLLTNMFVLFVFIMVLVMYCRIISLIQLMTRQVDWSMGELVQQAQKAGVNFMCYFCNFTICKRFFLLPKEIDDNTCPICKVEDWYKGPTFENTEECVCLCQL